MPFRGKLAQGTGTVGDLVAGLDWVAANAALPAVASLSLACKLAERRSRSHAATAATPTSVHETTLSIATPCMARSVGQTLAIAGSDLSTKFNATHYGDREGIYSYSNTGSCVDIFAPGVDIYAACGGPSAPAAACAA